MQRWSSQAHCGRWAAEPCAQTSGAARAADDTGSARRGAAVRERRGDCMSPLSGCGPANQGTATGRCAAGGAGGPDRRRESVPCHRSHQGRAAFDQHDRRRVPPLRSCGGRRGAEERAAAARAGRPVPQLGHPRRDRQRAVGLAAQARRGKARRRNQRGGVARSRRPCRALSRESPAAGCRDRVRRPRHRAVRRGADGEAAPRRTRRPCVAGRPGARRATPGLPAAVWGLPATRGTPLPSSSAWKRHGNRAMRRTWHRCWPRTSNCAARHA